MEIKTGKPISEEAAKYWYNLFSDDLCEFVEYFLDHYLTSDIPQFHRNIYKLLPQTKRLVLAAPRGFAKSHIIGVFYPLWCALFQKKSDITIISASEDLACEHIRKIKREIETNPKIKLFFGNQKSGKWSETHIRTKAGVDIRAKGAGAQIRGYRPDVILLDDIEDDESVESERRTNHLRSWILKACLNSLTPDGQFMMIGTIINPVCLLEEFLTSGRNWEKRRYKAYEDGEEKKENELWGARFNHKWLQNRKKEIGTWAFYNEYMNDPVSNEDAPIKPHQIRYYDKLPDVRNYVISVDPAYSEDKKADYKVASLIATDQNFNRYLVTYIRTHRPSGEFIDSFLNLYLRYKSDITAIGIPSSGVEKSFYQTVLRKAEARKLYPPFEELKNVFRTGTGVAKRKKKNRIIASLQPLFESGKYYMKKEHTEAKDELLTIGASRWDDIVDTMAYAEQIIQPVYFEPEEEDRGRYGEPLKSERKKPIFNYGY